MIVGLAPWLPTSIARMFMPGTSHLYSKLGEVQARVFADLIIGVARYILEAADVCRDTWRFGKLCPATRSSIAS